MSLLPEVRRQLVAAAEERRPRRTRGKSEALLAAAALGAAALVAAGLLLVLHPRPQVDQPAGSGGRHHLITPPGVIPNAWSQALNSAQRGVARQHSACRVPTSSYGPDRRVHVIDGPPPVDLTATYPAFDQPASGVHRLTLAAARKNMLGELYPVYLRYAWRQQMDGLTYIAAPVAGMSTQCIDEIVANFRAHAGTLPKANAGATPVGFAKQSLEQDYGESVCLSYYGGGGAGGGCQPVVNLKQDHGFHQVIGGGSGTAFTYVFFVSPQTASVTAVFPAEHSAGCTLHRLQITARPIHDSVAFRVHRGQFSPAPTFVARAADGRVLWTSSSEMARLTRIREERQALIAIGSGQKIGRGVAGQLSEC
jgi:hypothetical protein